MIRDNGILFDMSGVKVFLTGEPKSGKSTLLKKIIFDVQNKQGFITEEVKREGERVGFDVVTALNKRVALARIDFKTAYKVSKYSVDVQAFETALPELEVFQSDSLLYLDEIGQMQLYSKKFENMIDVYLTASNPFIATLTSVYTNEVVEKLRVLPDVYNFVITPDNRDETEQSIRKLFVDNGILTLHKN